MLAAGAGDALEGAAEATLCGVKAGFTKIQILPATKPTTTAAMTMPILAHRHGLELAAVAKQNRSRIARHETWCAMSLTLDKERGHPVCSSLSHEDLASWIAHRRITRR